MFFGEDKKFVTIRAAEKLTDRALWVAEVVKRKVPDLHQIITISEKKTVDVFMPKEEGLLKVEKERFLTIVEITLTKEPSSEQKKAPGYQDPIKKEDGEFLTKDKWEEREKERAERRESRDGDRDRRPPRRDREERGGERRRGRNS